MPHRINKKNIKYVMKWSVQDRAQKGDRKSEVKFQLGQLEKALLKGSIYIKIFLNVRGTEWRENIVVGC